MDDIEEIIFSFMSALAQHTEYRFVYVSNAKEVDAIAGDIVFLDLTGTNAGALQITEGVHVIRMTGGSKPAELHKPFSGKEVCKLVDSFEKETRWKKAA